MNTTTRTFETLLHPLTETVDAVPAAAWDHPSPCAGWTVRDVVRHLIDTQRDFLTGHGVDLGPAAEVDPDPALAWRTHADLVLDRLRDPEVAGITFDGHFGPATVGATMERFYGFDLLAHRWDIARAVGLETSFTEDELDQLETGIAGFGEALYMEGICKPALTPAADADRTTRVLAQLGRDAAA
ncbi:MAG: maleylpyruvate isomerase family mycothiol-dependent enzyme [Propionibacteriaceae bacterium]